ncbi:DUF6518 family protein [Streptomyces sp. NPDC051041]|uniref:DUF6518 family protein n=1 Tax=Streptomyces sp. NPDC051041 TaxID=3365640 RepID=UPI0037BBB1D3
MAVGICSPLLSSTNGPGLVVQAVLSSGWAYAALAFSVGMAGRGKASSALMGAISLAVAVVAYYVTQAGQGEFTSADLSDPTGQSQSFSWVEFLSMTSFWCVVALILGPILGVAGYFARKGPYRVACRILIPLVVIAELSMRLGNEASRQASAVVTTWSTVRAIAVAAVIIVMGYAIFGNWRRRSAKQLSSR